MRAKTIFFIMAFLPIMAFSQYDKMLQTMDDEMQTLENGKLILRFINVENGNPVDSAIVNIEGINEYITDLQGKVLIDPPADNTYALHFKKKGFISAIYNFEVVAGTIFYNRFFRFTLN